MSLANAFALLDDEGNEDVAVMAKNAPKKEVKEAPKKEEPAKPGKLGDPRSPHAAHVDHLNWHIVSLLRLAHPQMLASAAVSKD